MAKPSPFKEKGQAEEEALKRKHDDLKAAVGAVYALRVKGFKDSQIIMCQQILVEKKAVVTCFPPFAN